jgi:tetratricopeptide (TPR) repeat protein/biotin operon repressor
MMRATRSARLKRLHQALSEGLPVSLENLIQAAGADRATVVADIRHLRSDLGAPIRFVDGGYRYLSAYELPVLAVCLEHYELQQSIDLVGPELAWSAHHVGLDEPVQVRAMLGGPEVAHHMEARSRLLARLLHPGILSIYDRGQIDEVTAFESDGQLEQDMRWMVLPSIYDSDLSAYTAHAWKPLLESILTLLEAAAYAHAHGAFLIRALPAQVLASSDQRQIALSHLIAADELDTLLVPDLVGACFQAPERNGDWGRAPSIQEDLYALGSLFWFMISGEIPHGSARGVHDLVELQKEGDPTTLPAAFNLPKGFRNWLAMMRSPDPHARYASVADCRASLLEVDRLRGAQRWQPVQASIPTSWQRSWSSKVSKLDQGLGLNLIGLRPLPLVARNQERDRLWAVLHEALEGKNVCGCVVSGAPGVGKSRLLGWIKHRAMETGAAQVVRVRCNPAETPGLTTSSLVLGALRLDGLDTELTEFLHALSRVGMTNRYEQDALASIVAQPMGWADWPSIRFERSEDRFAVVARLLRRLSRRRGLVVLVDDAQWAVGALSIFRHLLATDGQRDLKLFFAIGTRDHEANDSSVVEKRQLNELLSERRVTHLPLERLRSEDMNHMLCDRMGMVSDLAERATEWCAGSPMMAHQLIESWHTEGALIGGHQGITHRNIAEIALPSDFARLWTQRLDQVFEAMSDGTKHIARWALEAGALLGRSVDRTEWSGMCRQLGFEPPVAVLELGVAAGLIAPVSGGWRFQHGTLRDALLLESESEQRLRNLHRAIAAFLSSETDHDLSRDLRCGEHLLAAGDHDVAFELLLKAEASARKSGNDLVAERSLELADRASAGISSERLAKHELNLQQRKADLMRLRGEWDHAHKAAVELEASALMADNAEALVLALRIQADCAFEHGNYPEASDLALRAQVAAQDSSDLEEAIRCELLLGLIFGAQSNWDQSISFYEAALTRINKSCPGHHELQGECLFHLGMVHHERGVLAKALPLFIKSLQHWEKCGGQRGMATVANALADVARGQGRMDRAMDWYQRAKKVYDSIGAWQANIVRLNLAIVMMLDDRFEDAHTEVLSCLQSFQGEGHESWLAIAYAFALPGCAHHGDWTDFDHYLTEATERLELLNFSDRDLAQVFEIAGELASANDEARRADLCFLQAAVQWRILDCPAEANAASLRAGVN